MTSRTYATLDRNRLGPGLLLNDSDLQITTSISCDGERKVLGSLPVMSGEYAYECYVWSTSQGDLSGLVSIGVAQPDSPLDAGVGSDALSVGYWPADGVVKTDDGTIDSPGESSERVCIGVHLSLGPSSATCSFLIDGAVVSTVDLPTGKAWLPAIGLGSSSAADINAAMNFGAWRFDGFDNTLRFGWSQQTAGLSTIALSLANEAFHSAPGDSPANTPYAPCVLNGDKLSARRSMRPWWLRDSGGRNPSALVPILLDNSTGRFNDLLRADVRDSPIIVDLPESGHGGAGSLAAADRFFTGIIDSVVLNKRNQVELRLRDTLTALDRTAWMRRMPPFCDESSAGQVVPFHRGGRRNVQLLLWSAPDRTWIITDAPVTNVTLVSDMAAPLDGNATPPQYMPALDHRGLQMQTDPVGRLSVDCSTVGAQSDLPGEADVLDGTGLFADWPVFGYTTTPPADCEFTPQHPDAKLGKFITSPTTVLRIVSKTPWNPAAGKFGQPLKIRTDAPLLAGRSYRLSFYLHGAYSTVVGGSVHSGGLMFRSALDADPASAIVGGNDASTVVTMAASGAGAQYTVDFRVPYGASRDLYMIATAAYPSATPSGETFVDVRAVRCELLGQFESLPLQDVSLDALLRNVLVDIEGEDAGIYSSADAEAVGEAAGHGLGLSYYDAPNLLDLLTDAADQFGAMVFTDEYGQIRIRRFRMPASDSTPVAAFNASNVDLTSVSIQRVKASDLTTEFWARPNVRPLTSGDFVTDTAVVTPAMRAAFQAPGQVAFSSTRPLAGEYTKREGAERRLLQIDDTIGARAEADLACGSAGVPLDLVTFDALASGLDIGKGPSVRMQRLYGADFIRVDLPQFGLRNALLTVVDTQPFPLAGKMTIGAIVGEIR